MENNINIIPKEIHFFWFGRNPKPELVLKCIDSWKKFFPDYEIIEWNEDNYDINKSAYMKEAYECKKWAFVSDYARFDVLYSRGGLYFDTDVEVLKPFPEELFTKYDGFTGVESTNDIAPGLVFACKKGNAILKEIVDDYNKSHFIVDGEQRPITVNKRLTDLFISKGFKKDGTLQVVDGIAVYPSQYFCGYDLDVFEPDIRDETLSIHHYASTWAYGSFARKRKIQKAIKKAVGVEGYRKILNFVRFLRGDKA